MERNKRKNLFIDKGFQTRFIVKFCIIVVASSLIIGFLLFFLSRNFTTVAIENTKVIVKSTPDFILPLIITAVTVATIFSAISVIVLTLFVSHKIAGPLYRFKKGVEILKGGNLNTNFKIRRTDQLQDLANALSDLASCLKEKCNSLKEKQLQLKEILQTSNDRGAINTKLQELQDILNYFKV